MLECREVKILVLSQSKTCLIVGHILNDHREMLIYIVVAKLYIVMNIWISRSKQGKYYFGLRQVTMVLRLYKVKGNNIVSSSYYIFKTLQ